MFTLYTDTPVAITRFDSNDDSVIVERVTWRDAIAIIHDNSSNPYEAVAAFASSGKIALDASGGILITISKD